MKLSQRRDRAIALAQHLDDASAAAEFEKLLRSVAPHPGVDNVEAAVAIGGALEKAGAQGTLRRLAGMLACTHPFADFLAAVANGGRYRELWAVTLHEYVLRGNELPEYRLTDHPLGVLPLVLLACEASISPAVYSESGVGCSLPFGPSRATPPTYDPAPHALQPTRMSTEPAIAQSFATWVEQSNATVEGKVLEFAAPPDVSAIYPDNLRILGLESLTDVRLLRQTTLDSVCEQLFSAAAYGGAYDSGVGGAYGRLTMWQSIAALAGVPLTTVEDVSAAAAECTWWYYDGTPWFNSVAWDIGLITLRADRRSMSVLAATDTD